MRGGGDDPFLGSCFVAAAEGEPLVPPSRFSMACQRLPVEQRMMCRKAHALNPPSVGTLRSTAAVDYETVFVGVCFIRKVQIARREGT